MSRLRLYEQDTMRSFIDGLGDKFKKARALSKYKDNRTVLYSELPSLSLSVGSFLIEKGLNQGDKVVILADSCPNWVLSYFGITYCGMTAVSILPAFSKPEVEKIVKHSDAKYIFAGSAHLSKVEDLGIGTVCIDDMKDLKTGEVVLKHKALEANLNKIKNMKIQSSDVASIIYTSGTTGEPKGVMLTHRNLLWNADTCAEPFIKIRKGMRVFSILPLAHVYEFTIGLLLCLINGCHITYFARPLAVTPLMKAFKDVRPHIVLSVPLLMEKVYSKAVAPKIGEGTKLVNLLRVPVIRSFIYKAIGHKLNESFGGRIRFFGIGGAPLDKQVEAFLHKAHFPYALGYGMTETSPFIAGCGPTFQKVGTLGPVLNGIDVRIDPQTGEIQTKSPAVMKGYYKNPELTSEVMTEDGWIKTGDVGYFKGTRLVINGRIKEMILTASGENIFPEAIENKLNHMDYVEESLIIPEDGKLLALIKLDMAGFVASLKGKAGDEKERALSYIQELREKINKVLPSNSRINEVEIQETPFERTPTSKIKRLAIIMSRKNKKK